MEKFNWGEWFNVMGHAIILFLIRVTISGIIVFYCWNFIVPVLFGLPAINIAQSIVLNIMVNYLLFNGGTSK